MISVLQAALLLLVAAGGWAVVAARDPIRQAMVASITGMTMTVLFVAFQAPDVALSMAAVGAVALPLMIVLAVAKTRRRE